MLASVIVLAGCRPSPSAPSAPLVELGDGIALVRLSGDSVLYEQQADDTLEPVLPSGASMTDFYATTSRAYVTLTEPLDVDGQPCTLVDFAIDRGPRPALECLDPAEDRLPTGVVLSDDRDVWVQWGDREDPEVRVYRDGVGTFVRVPDYDVGPGFAIEGGVALGHDVWWLDDDGTVGQETVDAEIQRIGWGPYQFTDSDRSLFRRSEGVERLEDRMEGDPYCSTYLTESGPAISMSDGPNLLLSIGTAWDDGYDVGPATCACDLDFDCEVFGGFTAFAQGDHASRYPAVGADGIAVITTDEEIQLIHDLVSEVFPLDGPASGVSQMGPDLYFWTTDPDGPDPLHQVDWTGDGFEVTAVPTWSSTTLNRIRLPDARTGGRRSPRPGAM